MEIAELHRWDLDYRAAVTLQNELAARRQVCAADVDSMQYVAGADVSYARGGREAMAAVVVVQLPELNAVETAVASAPLTFPYIPGLLSFREAPAVIEAFRTVRIRPDAAILDGHGLAHPRRFGLACHVGLWLDIPSVGCAKKKLIGEHEPVPVSAGGWKPLIHDGETVGCVLRTRDRVKPVFVSPGHRTDFATSTEIVRRCLRGYRLPEPTRLAHHEVTRARKQLRRRYIDAGGSL